MARLIQNNFSGGVLSPSLYGRSDLQSYYKGCARAENFIVAKEGSLRKRHGISSFFTHDSSRWGGIRMVPYMYDRTEGGIVLLLIDGTAAEGGNIVARLLRKDGSQVGEDTTFAEGKHTQDTLDTLQYKQIGDELWITGLDVFAVLRISDFTAENAAMETKTWKQTARPMTLSAFKCTGYSADDNAYDGLNETAYWYCAYIVVDGVASKMIEDSAYQRKSWVAGAYTKCTVSISTEQKNAGFDYVVIGKSNGGKGSYGEICRYYLEDFEGDTQLTFTDKNVSPGTGVYTQTNVLGDGFSIPLCVDCFQQRKVFANASTDGGRYPMTMWFSEVGNLDNFYSNRPSTDADAFSPTVSTTGPSFIRWLVAYHEMLVLFTESGLFSVGFSQTSGFSASSCRISRFSNMSVSPTIAPAITDAGVVFVGEDCKTVYTAAFDLQENMMKPVNRLVLAEHLTRKSKIRAMAVQSAPDNVIWAVTEDGRYLTFTFECNEEVYAWSDGRIEGAKIRDVISLGSVTDSDTGRTYADIVFLVEQNGTLYLAKPNGGHEDDIGGVKHPVKAVLTTLPPESQERTITGLKKNVKDVLLRLYETGSVSVVPTQGGESLDLVTARTGTDGLFTGTVKVMPRGYVNESGQMTYISDNDSPCEILQIVTEMEVS